MNRKATVLIVEDELIIAQNIERYLLHLQYDVMGICSSSVDVRSALLEERPDVVLMDIRIEGSEDGVALADWLYREQDIPVVFLTALMDEETLQRAKITQPFGYIVKPFSQRELHIALEIALYKVELERKLRDQEVLLQTLVEGMNQGFCLVGKDGRIAYANAELANLLGLPSGNDAVGVVLDEHLEPKGLFSSLINTGSRDPRQTKISNAFNGFEDVILTVQPVKEQDGGVKGGFASLTRLGKAQQE